ncbi:MAG TPA: FtsX-like permease family protein, partial [Thermomicrobiaceae bacterium]|nr:FtsX-like permease family protein [Thermomicrobiaceae bacterium]
MGSHRHRGRTLITIVLSGWHIVLKRARAGWMILSAAFLTMLLATTLLAAAPIYARAVAEAGLRRELRDAPVTGANLQVSLSLPGSSFTRADRQVRQALGPIVDLTHGSGSRAGFSSSFGLPGPNAANGNQRLAVFAFFDRLQDHAKLLAGSWPASSSGPVQVALPEPAAAALKLGVGDQLKLTDRINTGNVIPIRICGIYRVDNANDPFWFADPLSQTGIVNGQSFTSYGPFVVTSSAFLGNISLTPATLDWRVFPDFNGISVGQTGMLERLVNALPGQISPVLQGTTPQITTSLGTILSTTSRSLLVTRTAVLLLTIQLAILSAYALVLTAGLLTEERQTEYALLESRGASRGQLVTMAILEGLLLAIPAVVAGPWLAALSLRVLNDVGPLAGIGLTLKPAVDRNAVLLAILGGIVCLLALVRPAIFPPKPLHERSATRSILQRAGLDGGLLVIAAIGYWQLKHYGSPLTKTVRGSYGFDPLLVAAPALGLLAGAVIALRLIPLFAQAADRLAGKGSRVIFPLGAWQVARRPLRYARAALLLTLAVAIGLFSIAYSRTWNQSQADQAAYQVGAGIRLSPDERPGAIPGIDLTSAHETVPGVTASMPVGHQYLSLPGGSNVARLVLLDAKAAPGIVQFRSDLSGTSFS